MSELRLMNNFVFDSSVTLTASSADSEFPVSNLQDQVRSKVWRTTSTSAQSVIIDLQTTEDVDSIVVVFRKNQPIRLTGSATIRIEGNASSNFTSPLLSQDLFLDGDSEIISHFFSTAQSYRYWRLYIDDPGSAYSALEVSNIVISTSLKFTSSVGLGFSWSEIDNTKSQETRFGQRYYDTYPNQHLFKFEMPLATYDELESLLNFFNDQGSNECLAVGLDGQELFFDKDRFLVYGNLQKAFETKQSSGNFFTQGFSIKEML